MAQGIKRLHHFVHDGYLKQWKTDDAIYAYDRMERKYFQKTGKDLAAQRDLNYLSFDQEVIALLRYANADRENEYEKQVGRMIPCFLEALQACNYPHKNNNALEDFFGKFETDIATSISMVMNETPLINEKSQKAFDDLIFFFFIQLLRTPKSRSILSEEMVSIHSNGSTFTLDQKNEYIILQLLIGMFSMASEVIGMGCTIKLIRTSTEAELINCDAPVLLNSNRIRSIRDIQGQMPLSPTMLMEISGIGSRLKIETHAEIGKVEARKFNQRLFSSAKRWVYFSSASQRNKIVDSMKL